MILEILGFAWTFYYAICVVNIAANSHEDGEGWIVSSLGAMTWPWWFHKESMK